MSLSSRSLMNFSQMSSLKLLLKPLSAWTTCCLQDNILNISRPPLLLSVVYWWRSWTNFKTQAISFLMLKLISTYRLQVSLKFFIALNGASEATYTLVINTAQRLFPGFEPLSFYQVEQCLASITGIRSLTHDMCPNSCVGFTCPLAGADTVIDWSLRRPNFVRSLEYFYDHLSKIKFYEYKWFICNHLWEIQLSYWVRFEVYRIESVELLLIKVG